MLVFQSCIGINSYSTPIEVKLEDMNKFLEGMRSILNG